MFTSKNAIFNRNLFANSKISIGFMTLKDLRVVSDSDFQVLVGSTRKIRQTLTANFTDYLEKHYFLQMISNIGKLYIVGTIFCHKYEFGIITSK